MAKPNTAPSTSHPAQSDSGGRDLGAGNRAESNSGAGNPAESDSGGRDLGAGNRAESNSGAGNRAEGDLAQSNPNQSNPNQSDLAEGHLAQSDLAISYDRWAIEADDSVYLACRSLCEGLVAAGVCAAVVSPGSRSMPLTLTVDATPGLQTWVRIDERSAGFFALGLSKAQRRPVVLVCTSGTASANYLPAVVEAHYSGVPLIVLTADRPPELREWGAGQTINQHSLYGSHVRWFAETPVASELPPPQATRWFGLLAARAVATATSANPGPVHLNVPFREPLEPKVPQAPQTPQAPQAPLEHDGARRVIAANRRGTRLVGAASVLDSHGLDALVEFAASHERGIVVAGPMDASQRDADAVAAFCSRTGWPLLAEPCSQLRRELPGVVVTNHHDLLLRTPWADVLAPTAVVRIGGPPTCKPLRLWIERHRPEFACIDPAGTWTDASFTTSMHVRADVEVLAAVAEKIASVRPASNMQGEGAWARRWAEADRLAAAAIDSVLDGEPLLEAGIARQLGRSLPSGHALYVSNSMPVRDVDTFLEARCEPLAVYASRGASGIDGVTSAAAGVAASGTPTTLLIGDLAFRHDIGGLVALHDQPVQPIAGAGTSANTNMSTGANTNTSAGTSTGAGTSASAGMGTSASAGMGTSASAGAGTSAGAATERRSIESPATGADVGLGFTLVVVDNGGGTIFSFLPAHDVIEGSAFNRVMRTQPANSTSGLAAGLAQTLGFEHHHVVSLSQLDGLLADSPPDRIRIITIDVDAEANRAQHRRIAASVAQAVAGNEPVSLATR